MIQKKKLIGYNLSFNYIATEDQYTLNIIPYKYNEINLKQDGIWFCQAVTTCQVCNSIIHHMFLDCSLCLSCGDNIKNYLLGNYFLKNEIIGDCFSKDNINYQKIKFLVNQIIQGYKNGNK